MVYGRRNLRMLCDALSTLAEAVGRALGEPTYLHAIMPALMAKWQAMSDMEAGLLPLLECLMTIATSIGVHCRCVPAEQIVAPLNEGHCYLSILRLVVCPFICMSFASSTRSA